MLTIRLYSAYFTDCFARGVSFDQSVFFSVKINNGKLNTNVEQNLKPQTSLQPKTVIVKLSSSIKLYVWNCTIISEMLF